MNEPRYASLSGSLLARKGGAKPAMRPRPLSHGQMLDDLGWDDMGDSHDPPSQHMPSPIAALTPAPRSPVAREEAPVAREEAPVARYQAPVAREEAPIREEARFHQEPPVRHEAPVREEAQVHEERPVNEELVNEELPAREQPPLVHLQQRSLSERFAAIEEAETPNLSEAVVTALRTPRAKVKKDAPRRSEARKAAFTLRLDGDRHLKLRLASAITGKSSQQLVTGALDSFLESLPEIGTLARHVPARAGNSN